MTDDPALWDPDRYLAFADQRLRPGYDLIARIPHREPGVIVDLGCGTGELTAALARRWPHARVTGIDESAEMLARAESRFPSSEWPTIRWQQQEIRKWVPMKPVSILFSNAALHWLGEHETLFPRLFETVAPGGALAVQMPDNWDEPSHRLIGALVRDPRWNERSGSAFLSHPVAPAAAYLDWLQPAAAFIDAWRTTYYQVLEGADPILNWVKGSILRPILAALGPAQSESFLRELAASYRSAYPPGAEGKTHFPFSRLFLVATRR